MYSGLLPKGLSEADLSPDEEEENTQDEKQSSRTTTETEKCPEETSSSSSSPPDSCLPGVSQDLWQVCTDLDIR